MERQAGLGRSLEDVLDSLTPIEPADAPGHALFGLGTNDASALKKPKKASDDKKKKKKGKGKGKGKKKSKK